MGTEHSEIAARLADKAIEVSGLWDYTLERMRGPEGAAALAALDLNTLVRLVCALTDRLLKAGTLPGGYESEFEDLGPRDALLGSEITEEPL